MKTVSRVKIHISFNFYDFHALFELFHTSFHIVSDSKSDKTLQNTWCMWSPFMFSINRRGLTDSAHVPRVPTSDAQCTLSSCTSHQLVWSNMYMSNHVLFTSGTSQLHVKCTFNTNKNHMRWKISVRDL